MEFVVILILSNISNSNNNNKPRIGGCGFSSTFIQSSMVKPKRLFIPGVKRFLDDSTIAPLNISSTRTGFIDIPYVVPRWLAKSCPKCGIGPSNNQRIFSSLSSSMISRCQQRHRPFHLAGNGSREPKLSKISSWNFYSRQTGTDISGDTKQNFWWSLHTSL